MSERERVTIRQRSTRDVGGLLAKITVEKYRAKSLREAAKRNITPYEIIEETVDFEDVFLNEGINEIWTQLCGGGGTVYSNANARIGVGNSATAENATQTGLLGASSLFKAMLATFPTYGTSQKATFKSEFIDGEAEFAWEEFTVDNGAAANKNLHRKVTNKGTKPAGETWTCQIELSLT